MKLKSSTRRKMVVASLLSAVSFVLMLLQFSVPLMPGFIKFDFSELPALIAAFAYGPLWGAAVCAIKNILHLPFTTTFCVGELSNFLLGAVFVVTAGYVYRIKKCKKFAIIGALIGAVVMALVSFPVNYYITYPTYAHMMPIDLIIDAYRMAVPKASLNLGDSITKDLVKVLWIFNVPFNFIKGAFNTLIAIFIYKPLSPIIKGKIK